MDVSRYDEGPVAAQRPLRAAVSGDHGRLDGQRFDPQELLTPDEVCALLKMKRTWFYAELARGALRPLKLGRCTRVRRRDLEAYLARLEEAG